MKLRWLLLWVLLLVLLVPAGLLTYARLLDPGGGAWARLVSFTPLGGLLYLVAVPVLLLGAWRTSGLACGVQRVLAGVAVVALLLHGYWFSAPYVGTHRADAASRGAPMRVMTLNLMLGQARPSRVVETAVAHGADVLVLQEVTPAALHGLEGAGVATAFRYRAGRPAPGADGTMVLSRFRLTGTRRVPTGFGSWRVDVHRGGREVHLLAVHSRPPVGDGADWHDDQVAVRRAATAMDEPAVLAGDLNATLDHRPVRELEGRGFEDAAVQARSGWQPTWPSADPEGVLGLPVPSLLTLDHVMVGTFMHATDTVSVTVPGTDHRALMAVLVP